jgi:hypothetical protein
MPLTAFGTLINFILLELWIALGSLAAVVAYRLLTGRINIRGLLNDKSTGKIDPGRVQLLVTTLMVAAAYLAPPGGFADIRTQVGVGSLLGASNFFYLIQKYRALVPERGERHER